MRKALLMFVVIIASLPSAYATEITTETDDDTSGTFSGDYTVKSGATWTVSGSYEIEENTAIVVEEGGTMLVSGQMNAVADPVLNLAGTASVITPVDYIGESGVLRINFAEEILYGIDIEINNQTTEDFVGSQFDWNGSLDVANISVNITTNPFQISSIKSITLSPQMNSPVMLSADQLSGNGTSLVIPDRNNAWSLEIHGTLIVTGSIFGAGITCHGTCTLDGANMASTGPIEVYSSITVKDSVLNGGISDEDIILWDDATITWTNSTGTGDLTDNWVNILTTRTIGVQNGYVVFYGYDLGYDSISTSPLSDNSTFDPTKQGDNTIEIAADERDRMVRWQDGNGVIHEESASGMVVLVTQWGEYEQTISDLPKVNHFDVELPLPKLNFDSLEESSDESYINNRLGVMATVTNSGSVDASILFDCTTEGEAANVGLSNFKHTIEAGETAEIPMNWDSASEGDLVLECSIFVPYQFEGFDVVGNESAETNSVTWSEEDEAAASLVLPIIFGILAALAIGALVLRGVKAREAEKEVSSKYTIDLDDEETGKIE